MQMKSDKLHRINYIELGFIIFVSLMAVYYLWRMFFLVPWYDELYTYDSFISKGAVYSAIHWPLPNNHVGYSVLSGLLNVFHSSAVSLRGISFVAAVLNLILIKKASDLFFDEILSVIIAVLYSGMFMVNQQAVQGRGYTLGITCLLGAFLLMYKICTEQKPKFIICLGYVFCLVLSLYAVSSHVYYVIPLCVAGGLYLLYTKKYKRLVRLIMWSLLAAIIVGFLYSIIWLAIGSNLLVKDETSVFYGLSHFQMISHSPFQALKSGMDYMLATPYIQSEDRAGFTGRLLEFLYLLTAYFYKWPVFLSGVILIIGTVICGLKCLNGKKHNADDHGIYLYLVEICLTLFIPVVLFIQCKRPYYRVFTYVGVLIAFASGILLKEIFEVLTKKQIKGIFYILPVVYTLVCFCIFPYNEPYGYMETLCADALVHANIDSEDRVFVTDVNQQYLLNYLYGMQSEYQSKNDSDVIILDKRMLDSSFDQMVWEWLIPNGSIDENDLEGFECVYSNEQYLVYRQ